MESESMTDAVKMLRNAAIALSVLPLLDNIQESLEVDWNAETFKKTDEAIDQFVEQLGSLGYVVLPVLDATELLDLATAKHDALAPNTPIQ